MSANVSKHTLQVGGGSYHIHEMTGIESISKPFSFTCHVICQSSASVRGGIGQKATIRLTSPDSVTREIHGIVTHATIKPVPKGKDGYQVVFEVGSLLSHLSQEGGTRIFFRESAISLVYKILDQHGIYRNQCVEQLQRTYPIRAMIRQLHYESDLAFLQRILAREGIFFYGGVSLEGNEIIHISDCSECASFHPRAPLRLTLSSDQEAVDPRYVGAFDLHEIYHLVPDEVVVEAYCDAKPSVLVRKHSRISEAKQTNHDRVVRFFEGEALDPTEAQKRADDRRDRYQTQRKKWHFGSRLSDLRLGVRSRVGEQDIFVHEIKHTVTDNHVYINHVVGIPNDVSYKEPLVRPKADSVFLLGHVKARIDEETISDYSEFDANGRYQVKLLCDTEHGDKDKLAPWMRCVQPLAGEVSITGKPTGFHAPLKNGTEVIVGCLGGDPDRLVIVGARANNENANVVTDQATHSRWRTPGDSEILWVDEAKKSSLQFRTKQSDNIVLLDADEKAPKISMESRKGVIEANAGKVLSINVKEKFEEKIFAQKVEEVGEAHRLQTKEGNIHLQAPAEMVVRVKNEININSEGNINATIEQDLGIFPRKTATFITDAKDITVHVEKGDGVLDSAKNITVVGKGNGALEFSQQGRAGFSIAKDGAITLFGDKILANASTINYDGKINRETGGPSAPAAAMLGECLDLRVPSPIDLKAEFKDTGDPIEIKFSLTDPYEANGQDKYFVFYKEPYRMQLIGEKNRFGRVTEKGFNQDALKPGTEMQAFGVG